MVKIIADWVNVSGFKIINNGNYWNEVTVDIDVVIELNNVENVTISGIPILAIWAAGYVWPYVRIRARQTGCTRQHCKSLRMIQPVYPTAC